MWAEDIRAIFQNAGDFEERTVLAGGQTLTAFFIDGLTSGGDIAEYVVQPLTRLAPGTAAGQMNVVINRFGKQKWFL